MNAVAITGIGLIVPAGTDLSALKDPMPQRSNDALQISSVPQIDGLSKNDARRMSKLTRYSIFAANNALRMSGNSSEAMNIYIALTHGSTSLLEEFHTYLFDYGPEMASPNTFSNGVTNAPLSSISSFAKIKQGGTTILGYENAGCDALNYCANAIMDKEHDACLVGASEEYSEIVLDAYKKCGWYNTLNPKCLPYHFKSGDHKTGFGVGEGSAFFTVESKSHCNSRNGKALCLYKPVEIESDNISADMIICGSGAGPQDGYELDILKDIAKSNRGNKPVLLFSKPFFGESFALGSMLSCCMAFAALQNNIIIPSFPLHPDIINMYTTECTVPPHKILVISSGRNGQVSAGMFLENQSFE